MVITEHFTVWLYFYDEQLSQTRYDKLSKSRQQIKIKPRKKDNLSETVAVVDIGTPRLSLHQILNYRLFPICRFTDEVGNMQRLLKPILQLHLRRPPLGSPNLTEAIATLLTQQIYIIWHLSCRIFHSQDHVLWCRNVWLWPPASLCYTSFF
jgi:hypothetical protein